MELYVVLSVGYESSRILKIFADKQMAYDWVEQEGERRKGVRERKDDEMWHWYNDSLEIEEHELINEE